MSPSVFDPATNSCSNVLKELAYTVNVSEVAPDEGSRDQAYLKVDSIQALVVVQEDPVTAEEKNGKAMASVQQRFSIKFVKQGSSSQIVTGKSGNPGYIDGLPLLVGKADPATKAVAVAPEGFVVRGGDSTGRCYKSTDADLSEMGDPVLKFNVDLSYGCSIDYTLEELKQACDPIANEIEELEIFSNLKNIDSFGRFGNAYSYYPKVSKSQLVFF